jgi:hypothetical protein
MTHVEPPATSDWYDLAVTVAAVFKVLRLSDGDVDQSRIEALVPTAATNIEAKVDATVAVAPDVPVLDGPPPPAWAQTALELETLALYRAQGGTDPFATVPTVRDALVGGPAVAALVGAHKARWGIG